MGLTVSLPATPRRIVSLVPSQTELLHALGLDEEVVGITKFCVHPPGWRGIKKLVGGTKHFDFDAIASLNPDLIIGNKEENYQEGIDALRSNYPVWMSDIDTLDDAYAMIHQVCALVDRAAAAHTMVRAIQQAFSNQPPVAARRALYLIWRNPWMAAGTDTFIHAMMQQAGFINAVQASRYPELTIAHIQQLNPEVVLLSSEPYPFREHHQREVQAYCPQASVQLVDGEMFSWYGSRLLLAAEYFKTLRV